MRLRTSLPAAFLFVLASAALPAQSPPLSPEFQVNTSTTNYQGQSSVSMDDAGNFVVVWESYQNGAFADVYAQRFDAKGAPLGGEFLVNTYTTDYQGHPSVAVNPDGSFVVAWASYNQNEVKGTNIYAQRYDTSGSPTGGEFLVNTYTTGYQYGPAVASDANGNFVVVWSSYLQDGDVGGVYGQVFDNSGSPVNGEFRANQFTTGYQWRPSVAYGGNGDFVVAWESQGQDGDGYAVMARRYAPDGTPRADEFQVNQQTTGDQGAPAVAADSGGDFVVTWHSAGQDGSEFGIMARRFGSSGVPAGGEFQVNTYTTDYQTYPRIGMDAKGNFLITWRSFGQDGDAAGTYAQRFDASTARIGTEFQVNTTTSGYQDEGVPAVGRGGRFVITWSSPDSGSDSEIWARMASPLPAPMQVDPVPPSRPASPQGVAQNGILEPGESVTVAPSWTNNTPNALALTGTASNFTGPAGAVYTLTDASADYGSIASGATGGCLLIGNCYTMGVDNPATRPAAHWDAHFDEALSAGGTKTWAVHVGESFPDVTDDQPFYPYIENLFHNAITGGCGAGNYCPTSSVTRAQMAVFLLKARHGASFIPPTCTGIFTDVACPSPFADWIEELSHEGITGGCGAGIYCPANPVTRAQMAVFLLKAEHGSAYVPPVCTGKFDDVVCPSQFANWIEQLATENVTSGCGGNNYCPDSPNTRGQMAVFLVRTFGLVLYGP